MKFDGQIIIRDTSSVSKSASAIESESRLEENRKEKSTKQEEREKVQVAGSSEM